MHLCAPQRTCMCCDAPLCTMHFNISALCAEKKTSVQACFIGACLLIYWWRCVPGLQLLLWAAATTTASVQSACCSAPCLEATWAMTLQYSRAELMLQDKQPNIPIWECGQDSLFSCCPIQGWQSSLEWKKKRWGCSWGNWCFYSWDIALTKKRLHIGLKNRSCTPKYMHI